MMNRSVVYAVLFNIASVLLYILTVLFILDGTGWMPEAVSFSLGSVCLVIGILCSRKPSKKAAVPIPTESIRISETIRQS